LAATIGRLGCANRVAHHLADICRASVVGGQVGATVRSRMASAVSSVGCLPSAASSGFFRRPSGACAAHCSTPAP